MGLEYVGCLGNAIKCLGEFTSISVATLWVNRLAFSFKIFLELNPESNLPFLKLKIHSFSSSSIRLASFNFNKYLHQA